MNNLIKELVLYNYYIKSIRNLQSILRIQKWYRRYINNKNKSIYSFGTNTYNHMPTGTCNMSLLNMFWDYELIY